MKVYKKRCPNCLFSQNRFISDEGASAHMQECLEKDTHFSCHSELMPGGNNDQIVCAGFFQEHQDPDSAFYGCGQLLRIMGRMGGFEMVDQPEHSKDWNKV